MNLYIINEVLCDYTCGMCVIAAESLPRCEQIFMEEFAPVKMLISKNVIKKSLMKHQSK